MINDTLIFTNCLSRINNVITNSMVIIKETGPTIAVTIKYVVIVQEVVVHRCNRLSINICRILWTKKVLKVLLQQQAFNQNLQNNKPRAKLPVKFKSDYDFEVANKEFEDMCSRLDNVKVGEEANPEQVFYDFFNFVLLLSITQHLKCLNSYVPDVLGF